jgi:DNA-binding NtrC family response regulator
MSKAPEKQERFRVSAETSDCSAVYESLTAPQPHILIVDDDELICCHLERFLVQSGYTISTCRDAVAALEELQKEYVDLVLVDVRLPGMSGIELTRCIIQTWPDVPVIVMTGFGEIEIAVEVLKLGASDFIRKPFSPRAIEESVRFVLEQSRVIVGIRHLRHAVRSSCEFGGMLSRTAEMHKVFETIRMVAETDVTVVVEGETGTGKELVARAVHEKSARREGPFVTINCAGVPEALLEGELFGYERGAFTGADRTKAGKIELAHGGTLFLDEIESMPLTMQAKLLLVLQTQKVQRLGSNRWIQVDMRVVAATNVPLVDLKNKGVMRTDFYYRVNVIVIPLLPLRKRREDIPLLAQDFVRHHPIAARKGIIKISAQAMNQLLKHHWAGNIRELQNVLEKAIVLTKGRVVETVEIPENCPEAEESIDVAAPETSVLDETPLEEWVKQQERLYLIRRLQAFEGRIGPTARSCGVDVRTIYRKMRLYGLDKRDFTKRRVSNYAKLDDITPEYPEQHIDSLDPTSEVVRIDPTVSKNGSQEVF